MNLKALLLVMMSMKYVIAELKKIYIHINFVDNNSIGIQEYLVARYIAITGNSS